MKITHATKRIQESIKKACSYMANLTNKVHNKETNK